MKPESLHALVLDHHLGELSPEAAELLEHHLAANAPARAEAERLLQSLHATREAVLRHPELARVPVTPQAAARAVARPSRPSLMQGLARAAAVLLLAALAGVLGHMMTERLTAPATTGTPPSAPEPRRESPWAQYRMAFDPAGEGVRVVRVDAGKLEPKSLR